MPTLKGVRKSGPQGGSLELGASKMVRRYHLEYVVLADNKSQGPITIRSTAGLPLVGVSTYSYNGETDIYAVCKRKTPRRDTKNPLVWFVRVDFDNDANSQSQETESDSQAATARPPTIGWDAEFADVVLYKDFSSPRKDIVNPIGDAFDPPVTRRQIFPVLTIDRYEANFSPLTILAFTDHVCDDEFYGAPAGSALMTRIAAKQVIEDGVQLSRVTYRIRFALHDDMHKVVPLNQGSHYLDAPGGSRKAFIKDKSPYIGNLNLDGTAAAAGTRTFGGADGEGFEAYPEAPFGDLNLE